jgi:branched-subunit amino acid aminotransferase/4-amino-4-deoxychorismate lyase
MEKIFYVKGKFLKESQSFVSPKDLGFLRGYGVFEFFEIINRKPFYLKDHLKRFLNSAKILKIEHSFSIEDLEKIVFETLKKNKNFKDGFGRMILTGGDSKDSLFAKKPNLYFFLEEKRELPEIFYQKGAKVITKVFERVLPKAKTLCYAESILNLKEAKKKGALEVLICNEKGEILEGTTSNFFAVIKNKIFTPPSEKILEGVTRKIVFEICKKLKIEIKERKIFKKEIKNFDEAFLASTTKKILPVTRIDNIKIGESAGEITKKIMEEFEKIRKNFAKNESFS